MPFGERAESIPENFFWQAVLVRAFQDATAENARRSTATALKECDRARRYLLGGGRA